MQGNLIGLILSILATLVVGISFYWAVTTDKTTDVTSYLNETVANRNEAPIIMEIANSNNWGTVPGNYNSTLLDSLNVQYYNEDFLSSKSVNELLAKVNAGGNADDLVSEYFANSQNNVGKTSSATIGVNRTINPVFDFSGNTPAKMVFSPSIKNDPIFGYSENQTVPTINFEALNLWWQMQNMPSFLQAWQAFSQMTNKALDQTFQSFYYTHMMFAGNFDDQTWVNDTLFSFAVANLTVNQSTIDMQRSAIQNDIRYGMNTEGNLTIWISATLGTANSIAALKSHWFSGVYQIDDEWLNALTGSSSQIQTYITYSNNQLELLNVMNKTDISAKNMWAFQWATAGMLNNTNLCVNPNNCTAFYSVKSLDMSFMTMPEISQSGCDVAFTMEDGLELFDQDLESQTGAANAKTLLAAENYFAFQEMVETGQWMTLSGRFGLDQDKASCLFSYANQQAMYAPYQAYGNMLAQGVMKTMQVLHANFPINLAARTMAYRIDHNVQSAETVGENNLQADGLATCQHMVSMAVLNDTQVIEICTGQNFTNITNLQEWIFPLWYQNYTEFKQKTGMTTEQVTTFYATTNSSYFGYSLNATLSMIYHNYDCPSALDEYPDAGLTWENNCSATFISNAQWGSSMITLSPPYTDADYFPVDSTNETLSVIDWGVPGITKAPEYFYYSQFHYAPFSGAQSAPALDAWQVGNMTDNHYNYYGIGNTYNAKHLYFNYISNSYENVKPQISATMVQWDLSSAQKVYSVLACMDWLIQDFVLEGLTSTYTMKEMVFGWQSSLVAELEFTPTTNYTSRHYQNGDAIYYAQSITPFIQGSSWSGSNSNSYVSVSTGNLYPITTGRIMAMNDYEYPNTKMHVNNGLGSSVLLPFRCSNANFTIDNVYTWQQGMPGNTYAPNITTLNTMNMQLEKQYYSSNATICANGTGDSCTSFAENYNSYGQNIYNVTDDYVPVNNCGTRIFSHGTLSQTSTVDVMSGASTGYVAEQTSMLSWKSLTSPHPNGGDERVHLHPFPSLKVLANLGGATISVNLGGSKSTFGVTTGDFVNTTYPVDTTAPTKEVQVPVITPTTERVIVIFMVVIYSLLLVFTIVLAVGFGVSMHKARAAETAHANHVLYDNLNPSGENAVPSGGDE